MKPVSDSSHPETLGAFVTGILDPSERAAVAEHVRSCSACQVELDGLTTFKSSLDATPADGVLDHLERLAAHRRSAEDNQTSAPRPDPDLVLDDVDDVDGLDGLDGLDLEDLDLEALGLEGLDLDISGHPADDLVLARTINAMRTESARQRRPRLLLLAAAVLILAVAAGSATGVILALSDRSRPLSEAGAQMADSRSLQVTDPGTGAGLTVGITPAGGGTWSRLAVSVTGIAPGTTCRIIAVAADGTRELAGSWVTARPAAGAPPGVVQGSTSIPPSQLAIIEITDASDRHLVGLRA